jgi:hypothetical protein
MRAEIQIANGELSVGLDPSPRIGFFASLKIRGRRFEFDQLSPECDPQKPLLSLLLWLADHGHDLYTRDDLDAALLAHAGIDEDRLSPGAALALAIIEALKRAAAE